MNLASGKWRVTLAISVGNISSMFSVSRFDTFLRGAISPAFTGFTLATDARPNPNTTTTQERTANRTAVRSALVIDVPGTWNNRLNEGNVAIPLARALIDAGVNGVTTQALIDAIQHSRAISTDRSAPVTTVRLTLSRLTATAPHRVLPGVGAHNTPAVREAPPVVTHNAPVAPTVTEAASESHVLQASNPTQVGKPVASEGLSVVNTKAIVDSIQSMSWGTILGISLLGLAVAGGIIYYVTEK